jgi:tRNA pseudouridine(38-40) synthase
VPHTPEHLTTTAAAALISRSVAVNTQHKQIHWNRAARTDKGVSAVCQVVSAKLVVEPAGSFVERVNAALPDQVGRCVQWLRSQQTRSGVHSLNAAPR